MSFCWCSLLTKYATENSNAVYCSYVASRNNICDAFVGMLVEMLGRMFVGKKMMGQNNIQNKFINNRSSSWV
jgi:hypothetical protein